MIKKIVLTLLFLFCISTIVEAQQELYWIDTTGGVNILRKVSNKYPFPVSTNGGYLDSISNMSSSVIGGYLDSIIAARINGGYLDSISNMSSSVIGGYLDSIIAARINGGYLDSITEIINGHIFTSDTTQLKYRNSFSLTTGDSIAQDTLYGNFNKLFIGGSDTGGTFTDSVVTELWDALLSVWKQVGVTNMWNGNFYSYVSPGAGETAEYVLDHEVVDIIRFRLINEEYVSGRTFEISWTGKGDK